MTLGHQLSAAEVLERVRRRWDLSRPLPVPVPGWLRCPVCGDEHPHPRYWRLHQRPHSRILWRCDVSWKCTDCSHVWVHGIPLPEAYCERWASTADGPMAPPYVHIGWDRARELLGES